MKTKIVLLDLGGVVFNSTGESNQKIDWEVITKLNNKYGYQLNIGNDVFGNFMEEYNDLTNQSLNGKDFLRLVFDTLKFNQELVNLLSKDYRIFIVSDNYRENIAYISQRYNFADWSEKQFYSFDFKMHKAESDFFKLLLEELKVNTEDLVFIDDSISKIESAKKHNIKGILFKSNEQVKADLNLK